MIKQTSFTELEINLIKFFLINITEKFGIREISRKTKIDYKLIHSTVQKLVKKGVLLKQRQANLDLCSLNLRGDLSYVLFVEQIRKNDFFLKHKDLQKFIEEISTKIKELYFTLVLFGSFAKGKEHKRSDIDLLIIAPTKDIAEEIRRVINSESVLIQRDIQSITLDEKEFISNLSDKKNNVIKEAFKNHIMIFGAEAFYKGVNEVL